jgi:hypothetical protein
VKAPTVVGVGNALVDHTYLLTNLPEADGGAVTHAPLIHHIEACL